MLSQLIEQLSKDLGFEMPLFSQDSIVTIAFEPKIDVSFQQFGEDSIRLFSKLSGIPVEKVEQCYYDAICANLLGKETGENFLGLDDSGKFLILNRLLKLPLTYPEFHEALEDFLNYADVLKIQLIEQLSTQQQTQRSHL